MSKPETPPTGILDLGSRPCGRHGTAYSDRCSECDHSRFPIPYDPVPEWLWCGGVKEPVNGKR